MKNNIITAICILIISQINFAQVGTNGENRNEEGRTCEWNITLPLSKMK
jgi:hypothetical protein